MTKKTWIIIVVTLGLATTVGMVAFSVVYERYMEAVAISCIVPVLTWFATGAGKLGNSPDSLPGLREEQEQPEGDDDRDEDQRPQ